MKKRLYFLGGVLVGVMLMTSVAMGVQVYKHFNDRLSAVEGYIHGLDMMLRGQHPQQQRVQPQRQQDVNRDDRRRAV